MLVGESGSPAVRLSGNLPLVIVSTVEQEQAGLPKSIARDLVSLMRSMLVTGRLGNDERGWLLRLLVCAASVEPEFWDDVLPAVAAETHSAVAYDVLRHSQQRLAFRPRGH
jgi:hypothetical protein